MADVSVLIRVAHTATTNRPFDWSWKVEGTDDAFQPLGINSQFGEVSVGASDSFTLKLVPDPGDDCVFQSSPLTFFTSFQLTDTFTPEWYTQPSGGNSSITFIDHNVNQVKRTYYFKLNAIYTPSGQTADTIQSPDPTIINVGTDGTLLFEFGWKAAQESLRESAATAV